MDKYIFPAIFEARSKNGYYITFPDLPGCITHGETVEDAFAMAKEALELHLYGMEEDSNSIPKPTVPNQIIVNNNSFVTLVEAWMPLIRNQIANKAVKKTLTIPKWLNDAAEEKKINFSQILQTALKERLGIDR